MRAKLARVVGGMVAACLAFAGINSQRALGGLIIDFQNGGSVVTDNGAGDSDPTVGRIINSSFIAGFGIEITVAASNSPGTPSSGLLQVQSLDVQNGNPGTATLIVKVSDTNFTLPGAGASPMILQSGVGGTFTQSPVGDFVTFQSFADPNNSQPAGPVLTPIQTFSKTNADLTQSFSSTTSANWARNAGPYSLANITNISLSPNAQMNISGTTITFVPEPASLAALTLGALVIRRRRK